MHRPPCRMDSPPPHPLHTGNKPRPLLNRLPPNMGRWPPNTGQLPRLTINPVGQWEVPSRSTRLTTPLPLHFRPCPRPHPLPNLSLGAESATEWPRPPSRAATHPLLRLGLPCPRQEPPQPSPPVLSSPLHRSPPLGSPLVCPLPPDHPPLGWPP